MVFLVSVLYGYYLCFECSGKLLELRLVCSFLLWHLILLESSVDGLVHVL